MQNRNPVVYGLTLHLVAEWDNVNCLTSVFPAQLIGVESNVTIAVA